MPTEGSQSLRGASPCTATHGDSSSPHILTRSLGCRSRCYPHLADVETEAQRGGQPRVRQWTWDPNPGTQPTTTYTHGLREATRMRIGLSRDQPKALADFQVVPMSQAPQSPHLQGFKGWNFNDLNKTKHIISVSCHLGL